MLGMAFELEKMIGQHIKGGVLSVPIGSRALSSQQLLAVLEKRWIRYCTQIVSVLVYIIS